MLKPIRIPTLVIWVIALITYLACSTENEVANKAVSRIEPVAVTDTVSDDSDDPAIWLHPEDPSKSLLLGTDKAGILFVFDLDGKIIRQVHGDDMKRLNNVDVEYGLSIRGQPVDIAVATDRDAGKLYAFRLPDFERLATLDAFDGEEEHRPMGVSLYKRPADKAIFAIVSRKLGPSGAYLWQYRITGNADMGVTFAKVRAFGRFSGVNEDGDGEIEAVAVDDELGYVYYSDELYGIRKYQADPDAPDANQELAVFGMDGFARDREGISIYKVDAKTGYILVSDQQANKFRVFAREGQDDNPHNHPLLKAIDVSTSDSDGSDATHVALGERYPHGLFIAMSDDKTFQLYSWTDLAGSDLQLAKDSNMQTIMR